MASSRKFTNMKKLILISYIHVLRTKWNRGVVSVWIGKGKKFKIVLEFYNF